MKIIKYKMLTHEEYDEQGNLLDDCFANISMGWNESNELIAKAEAYNGEYTIEDDGQPETYQPTVQEQLDAQAAAIMELMEVVLNG